MLRFGINDTSAELILTLSEKVTINAPFYHLKFTHTTTKDVVSVVKDSADDESDYTTRYNKYSINPSVVFDDQNVGEWRYEVHQRSAADSADGILLESGILILTPAVTFEFTQPSLSTSFTTYAG
jgi:hypothetical protein